jgi:hypothetical protein
MYACHVPTIRPYKDILIKLTEYENIIEIQAAEIELLKAQIASLTAGTVVTTNGISAIEFKSTAVIPYKYIRYVELFGYPDYTTGFDPVKLASIT